MGNAASTAALLSDTKRFSREELRGIMAEKFNEEAFGALADEAGTVSKQQLLELVDTAGVRLSSAPSLLASASTGGDLKPGKVVAESLSRPYDLVVVGGGPAGVAGVLRAAVLGRRALLVATPGDFTGEPDPDGGAVVDPFLGAPTGLFSKALRDTAKHLDIRSLRSLGVDDDIIWRQVGLTSTMYYSVAS